MPRGKAWTEERFNEAAQWQIENNESDNATEKLFGISHGYMKKLRIKFKAKRPRGPGRPKRLSFMDIPGITQSTSGPVTIIRCQPNQLAEVLGGLNGAQGRNR